MIWKSSLTLNVQFVSYTLYLLPLVFVRSQLFSVFTYGCYYCRRSTGMMNFVAFTNGQMAKWRAFHMPTHIRLNWSLSPFLWAPINLHKDVLLSNYPFWCSKYLFMFIFAVRCKGSSFFILFVLRSQFLPESMRPNWINTHIVCQARNKSRQQRGTTKSSKPMLTYEFLNGLQLVKWYEYK